MLNRSQSQEVGHGAIAAQAGGDVTITNVGLTYAEVREVALDVFRANFIQLSGEAKDIARTRAEEITEDFLKRLEREHPAGLNKAKDPDFQYSLYSVQKEYAKCGDKDLGDLLVDLLVDRSKQDQRDILQLVLNESINTAPKLTDAQLATLAVIFLLRYTQNLGIGNHKMLGEYLDQHVLPFTTKLGKNQACYQHLQFTGCGSVQVVVHSLPAILGEIYQGLFLKGFDAGEIHARGITVGMDQRFFIPCLNDASKVQINAINGPSLKDKLSTCSITQEDSTKILALFGEGRMNEAEIKSKYIEVRPYMAEVFGTWADSDMKSFMLTSVGIAIGHANIKRLIGGEFANLKIWIN